MRKKKEGMRCKCKRRKTEECRRRMERVEQQGSNGEENAAMKIGNQKRRRRRQRGALDTGARRKV